MQDWINKIFSLKTFPGQLIFVAWCSSLSLIALPDTYLKKFLLSDFKSSYAQYIGPILLVSSVIMLWMTGKYIIGRISHRKNAKNWRISVMKDMENLNSNEIAVMREFFFQGKDTIQTPLSDETVISLENKGLIYKATNSAVVNMLDMAFPYSITEYVKENLTNRHLNLPRDNERINDEIKRKLNNQRPNWAIEIQRNNQMMDSLTSW